MAEKGYPHRICNYCQLQLNMFYVFLKKAAKSHTEFTEKLGENKALINFESSLGEEPDVEQNLTDVFTVNNHLEAISEAEVQIENDYVIEEITIKEESETVDSESDIHDLEESENIANEMSGDEVDESAFIHCKLR